MGRNGQFHFDYVEIRHLGNIQEDMALYAVVTVDRYLVRELDLRAETFFFFLKESLLLSSKFICWFKCIYSECSCLYSRI